MTSMNHQSRSWHELSSRRQPSSASDQNLVNSSWDGQQSASQLGFAHRLQLLNGGVANGTGVDGMNQAANQSSQGAMVNAGHPFGAVALYNTSQQLEQMSMHNSQGMLQGQNYMSSGQASSVGRANMSAMVSQLSSKAEVMDPLSFQNPFAESLDAAEERPSCPLNLNGQSSLPSMPQGFFSSMNRVSRHRATSDPPGLIAYRNDQSKKRMIDSSLIPVPENSAGMMRQQQQVPSVIPPAPSNKFAIASMDSDSLVHNSCKLYPTTLTVVESALRFDPPAIRRRIPLVCGRVDDDEKESSRKRKRPLHYCYPINIAIHFEASQEVIDLLSREGSDVLCLPDGPDSAGSLGIALALRRDISMIRALLKANPRCAQTPDRHFHYPLHIAVRTKGSSLAIIKEIYEAFPEALNKQNFHGEKPMDVATRTAVCSDEVIDYLQQKMLGNSSSMNMVEEDLGDDLLNSFDV